MADITEYDQQRRQSYQRTVKSGEDVANAQSTERMTNAAGLGSREKKSSRQPPKASDFAGDMRAYGEALRKFRVEEESNPDSQAKSRALARMRP